MASNGSSNAPADAHPGSQVGGHAAEARQQSADDSPLLDQVLRINEHDDSAGHVAAAIDLNTLPGSEEEGRSSHTAPSRVFLALLFSPAALAWRWRELSRQLWTAD